MQGLLLLSFEKFKSINSVINKGKFNFWNSFERVPRYTKALIRALIQIAVPGRLCLN